MKNKVKEFLGIFCLILILGISFFISLIFGAEKSDSFIILELRLPRSFLVLLAGSLLAASGSVFQMFFRNPLAEPGLLGISSGATLGAVISASLGSISFCGGYFSTVNLFAFLGAFLSGLILVLISSVTGKKVSSVVLLLCGTALGTLYSSISSAFLLMHNKELYGIFTWLLGSFNGRGFDELKFVLVPGAVSFVRMLFISNTLDLLNGGEENAGFLGVNVKLLRVMVILSGSLAFSFAVCAGGTISFVGLVAPHIMRKLFSPKSRILIISSALGGAILLLITDTLCRVVVRPGELPSGIITSLIGVPFFLTLIFKKRRVE